MQGLHRLCADAALGEVDDPRRRFAVEGIVDEAKIGKHILDFLTLEELEATKYFIRNPVPRELLFEGTGEGVESHQHGKIRIAIALTKEPRDGVRDIARLAALLVRLKHFRGRTLVVFRPEGLILSPAVVVNDEVGKFQNIFGGAVVAFQLEHVRALEILFEMQDILNLRTTPPVDGLVVVADHEQIPVHGRKQFDNLVLYLVGVLELVYEDIAEFAAQILAHVLVLAEQIARLVEQIVEIEGVVFFQMLLIAYVDLHDIVDIPFSCVLLGVAFGLEPEHLGVGDMPFHVFEELFVVKITFLKGLLDDVVALRFAVNGEVGLNPRLFGEHTQNAHAHTVNGAHPRAGDVHDGGKAFLHFIRGFVGEGDGEDRLGGHFHVLDEVGDTRGEHARLAAPRPRQHEDGPLRLHHGSDLFFIEFFKDFIHLCHNGTIIPQSPPFCKPSSREFWEK